MVAGLDTLKSFVDANTQAQAAAAAAQVEVARQQSDGAKHQADVQLEIAKLGAEHDRAALRMAATITGAALLIAAGVIAAAVWAQRFEVATHALATLLGAGVGWSAASGRRPAR